MNPASSFANSPWPQLGPLLANTPAEVYKFLPFALAPVMANPLSMAMNDVDERASLPQQASELLYVSTAGVLCKAGKSWLSDILYCDIGSHCPACNSTGAAEGLHCITACTVTQQADIRQQSPPTCVLTDVAVSAPACPACVACPSCTVCNASQGLVDMLPQLPALRLVLPPETLSWRLQLIQQGIDWMKPRYKDVKQRALVLGSDRDFLIPSDKEAERLQKELPRARSRILQNRSHAPLMEAGVDLYNIMKVGAAC